MRSFPLKFSIPHPNLNLVSDIPLFPALGYGVDERFIQPICLKWNFSPTVVDSIVSSSQRFHRSRPLRAGAYSGEAMESLGCFQSNDTLDSTVDQANAENNRENERRRKIGMANKGKVPWNKGRKHSEETRERIRQRTIEALRDPKIKRKMAEHPRPHSDQIKAKISSSLRRLWRQRLKGKRSKQKFFSFWGDSIADAAKLGWTDQENLEWDSYDIIKQELKAEQLKRISEKDLAKGIAKARSEQAAEARAGKIAVVEQKRKEREEKKKMKETLKETAENKDDLAIAQLKQRLEKIHRKKTVTVQITGGGDTMLSNIEKMDLECMRKEKARRGKVSLADQIQAAKSMRAESTDRQALVASYTTTE